MDELPATQQLPSVPVIFCNDDGSPLRVFVEACGIVYRPRLVRTLKKAGADICNDPRQAQVILVDPRTYEGRKFVRDWGSDMNKVVLEYTWVSKSLSAGKALKESDQWGNCLTHDDGLPLDSETNFEDEFTNNPLPTPRITPVETSMASRPSTAATQSSMAANVTPRNQEPAVAQSPMSFESVTASSSAQNNGFQFSATDVQIPSTPIQHIGPGFLSPVQHYQPGGISPAQFMQQSMQAGMVTPMAQWQHVWAQMMGSVLSQGAPQFNSDPFAMSLIDALRTHGVVSYPNPQFQEGVATLPNSSNLEPPEVTQPPTPESNMVTASGSSISHKGKTFSARHPPQIGRRSAHRVRSCSPPESSSSTMSHIKKQKRKEKSPESRRKTITYIGPTRPLHSTESPARTLQENKSHKIFVNEKGKAMTFFVQVDQPNRLNVVTSIKKNGGRISNTQTIADYAILYSQSKTFIDLLTSTIEAGKTAVSPAFIHDSVKEGALLESNEYKFRVPGKGKKAAARYSSSDIEELSTSEAPKRKLSQSQEFQEKGKRAKQGNGVLSTDVQPFVKLEPEEIQLIFDRPRAPSPTPPPISMHQSSYKGFKYSDIEREYALKYMKILLERDHQMSGQVIAEHLYRKLPHHTLKSWRSYICAVNMREEVERLRRRAAVACRKSLNQPPKEHMNEESGDVNMNDVEADSSGPVNMEDVRKKDEEDDLNTICNFFAFGGSDRQADNNDQDALWTRLSEMATCKTATSWAEFYDRHYPVIQERYAGLIGTTAQSNATENDMTL